MVSILLYILLYFYVVSINNSFYHTLGFVDIDSDIKPIVEEGFGIDYRGSKDIYQEYYIESDEEYNSLINQINQSDGWKKGNIEDGLFYKFRENFDNNELLGKNCYYFFEAMYDDNKDIVDVHDYNEYNRKRYKLFAFDYVVSIFDQDKRMLYIYITKD